ncbi:hypothetical protein C5167_042274 [Papaver somniferum]|uniref:Uncharacterized protein n=1 Tax=Papaver somniferum TaxID=3469 RepID=A0A4Y7L5J4_PAPSO|nr:hypothetical protein C5167_042274 [Papaver somniferum]
MDEMSVEEAAKFSIRWLDGMDSKSTDFCIKACTFVGASLGYEGSIHFLEKMPRHEEMLYHFNQVFSHNIPVGLKEVWWETIWTWSFIFSHTEKNCLDLLYVWNSVEIVVVIVGYGGWDEVDNFMVQSRRFSSGHLGEMVAFINDVLTILMIQPMTKEFERDLTSGPRAARIQWQVLYPVSAQ